MLDGRALGTGLQRGVNSRRMQGKMLTHAAGVDGDSGVLADEVLLGLRDGDVLQDRLQNALSGNRRLARCGIRKRVAQVLRDVLQRPDVEVRRRVFDCGFEIGDGDRAHALAFSAAALPARRPKTQHSSRLFPIMRLRPCVPPAISPHA